MKKHIYYFTFIILELLLLVVIVILAIKIKKSLREQSERIQFVTQIKKEDLIFDSENLKYFYEPKPNSVQLDQPNWLGYEAKYTINNDSLNERFSYTLNHDTSTYRIITIGDSFTFGQYINTPENYSEILEDSLNKLKCKNIKHFDVINLGVEGYDVTYTIEHFIKRGIKYNPDMVVWLLNGHNLDQVDELTYQIRPTMKQEGFLDFNSKTNRFEVKEQAIKVVKKIYSEKLRLEYLKRAFEKMFNNYKGKLIVMTFKDEKIPNKNLLEEFLQKTKNIYYPYLYNTWTDETLHLKDYHPNKKGHQKIAEDMFRYLNENFLKCQNMK